MYQFHLFLQPMPLSRIASWALSPSSIAALDGFYFIEYLLRYLSLILSTITMVA